MLNKRILVVDDNPIWLRLASMILSRAGFRTFTAHTGRLGMQLVADQQPDLILLDVMMPDMTGLEISRHIRNNLPNGDKIIIVVVTASPRKIQEQMLEAGADICLQKPVDGEQLIEIVEQLLATPIVTEEE